MLNFLSLIPASDNRRRSLKRALSLLYFDGEQSILSLSKHIGSSIPTTTSLVNDLVKQNLVVETGLSQSNGGRKPLNYALAPNSGIVVSVCIYQNYFLIGIYDWVNTRLYLEKVEGIDIESSELSLIEIEKSLRKALTETRIDTEKILGIGIVLRGLVNTSLGKSYSYLNQSDKSIVSHFSELFSCPVIVENDSRILALADLYFGKAKGVKNAVFINLGRGLGVGMVVNGQVVSGKSGFAGELGHTQFFPNGKLCYCGRTGCLETEVSGLAMEEAFKTRANTSHFKSSLKDRFTNLDKISFTDIIEAASEGDMLCIDLLNNVGNALGKGTAHLINMFNPELVLISGEFARANNYLKLPLMQHANKYSLPILYDDCRIELSDLDYTAPLLGALALVMQHALND